MGENVCIITGASRGIGRAIAVDMSNKDLADILVLLSRSVKDLQKTVTLMNSEKEILICPMDLCDEQAIINVVDEVHNKFGRIDYLVNCAGFVDPKSILETTYENLDRTFKTNIISVYVLTREVTRYMKKIGGKIINVASTAGMTPRPGWSAYAASKAALINLSETLSAELESFDIKVYCVSPGRCATDLRKVLAPEEDPTTIMQPEEVAEVITSLLGDAGSCLDGQNMVIRKQLQKK